MSIIYSKQEQILIKNKIKPLEKQIDEIKSYIQALDLGKEVDSESITQEDLEKFKEKYKEDLAEFKESAVKASSELTKKQIGKYQDEVIEQFKIHSLEIQSKKNGLPAYKRTLYDILRKTSWALTASGGAVVLMDFLGKGDFSLEGVRNLGITLALALLSWLQENQKNIRKTKK